MRVVTKLFSWGMLLTLMLSFSAETKAQEEESPISFGVGLESRYVWRGYNYNGASPSVQPSFSVSFGGLEIGAWGGYQLGGIGLVGGDDNGVAAETDVYVSYTVADMVTLTVTDFFYHNEAGTGEVNKYFDYEAGNGHWIEASVGVAPEGFPLSFLAAVNVYGDRHVPEGETEDEEAFSTYLEATYSKSLTGGVDFKAFAGFAIAPETSGWYTGYSGEGVTGFVNVGVAAEKEIKFTDSFSLPVYSKVIFNPAQENYYIVFGLSI